MSQEYEDLAFVNISAALGSCGRLRMIEASAFAFGRRAPSESAKGQSTVFFDRWDELIQLDAAIPSWVEAATGVSSNLLKTAEPRASAVGSLLDFIGQKTIVALDAERAISILKLEAELIGRPWSGRYVDISSVVFKHYLPDLTSHGLDEVCSALGIHPADDERTAVRDNLRALQAYMSAIQVDKTRNIAVELTFDVRPPPGAEIAFIDLETTGLDSSHCCVTEISVQVWRMDRGVVNSFTSLVRIPGVVPREITELTGISDEMLSAAPPISEVLPRALAVIGRRTIAAYNAPFDMGFLETECRRLGLVLSNPSFCVMEQAQSVLGYLPGGFKLANVADVLGIQEVGPSHRAEADATLALNVAVAIWNGQLPYGRENLTIKMVCEIHTSGRPVPPPVVVWEAECAPILRQVADQVECSVWTRDRSEYINVYGPEGGYGEGVIARIYKDENPELASVILTGDEVHCVAKKVGDEAFEVHLTHVSR